MFLNYYIWLDSIRKRDLSLIYTNSCPLLDKVHRWRGKRKKEKKKEKNSEVCLWRLGIESLWKHCGTRVKGIMKMASASFLFCRDECRRIERSSFGENNCILLFRSREQDRLKQKVGGGSEIEEKWQFLFLMKQIIAPILTDSIYYTWLKFYYEISEKYK